MYNVPLDVIVCIIFRFIQTRQSRLCNIDAIVGWRIVLENLRNVLGVFIVEMSLQYSIDIS